MEVKSKQNQYSFNTDSISFKAVSENGNKRFYVQGYISTADLDAYNDVVTQEAMDSMLTQINERQITIDYEHEAWRDDNTILPVGKIVEAKMDETGLWVKCELNKSSPKFKNLWGSIKDGFVNAFSIAFKPLKTTFKMIDDVKVRMLNDLVLLNVALTGAPVNNSATVTGFNMKSVMLKSIADFDSQENKTEVTPMVDEIQPEAVVNAEEPVEEKSEPVEEVVEAVEEPAVEEKSEPVVEEKSQSEVAIEKLTAELKSMQEKLESTDAELKSLKETEVFKAKSEAIPEVKSEDEKPRDVLSFI